MLEQTASSRPTFQFLLVSRASRVQRGEGACQSVARYQDSPRGASCLRSVCVAPLLGAWLTGARAARARPLMCGVPAPTALLISSPGPRKVPCASAPGAYECEAFRLFPRLCPSPRVAAHAKVLVGCRRGELAERTFEIDA